MGYGKESVVSQEQPEIELQEDERFKGRSEIGDLLYQSNPMVAWSKNQTGDREDRSDGKRDPKFSWQSPETKDLIKDLHMNDIESLDPDINNYESLRAAVARSQEVNSAAAHTDHALGAWNIPANLAAGIVTDPTMIISGGVWGGAKTAANLYNLNKVQKTMMGVTLGSVEGLAYDQLSQGTRMTDSAGETLFATAFGGTVGALLGRYTLDINPSIVDGTTHTERIADGVTTGVAQQGAKEADEATTNGSIKGMNGATIWTPGSRLFTSKDDSVLDFANNMINPHKALKDRDGNLVTTRVSAEDHKRDLEKDHTKMQHAVDVSYSQAKKDGDYAGSREDFDVDVRDHYIDSRSNTERALHRNMPRNLDEVVALGENFKIPKDIVGTKAREAFKREAQVKRYIDENMPDIDLSHSNPYVQRAAEDIAHYYNGQAVHLKSSGMKGMENIKPNNHLPQSFNVSRMEANKEDFVDKLSASMAEHAINIGKTHKQLREGAEGVFEKVLNTHYMRDITSGGKQTKATNRRTLSYFTGDMKQYLNSDLNEISTKYSRETSGRIAAQRTLGFEGADDFKRYLESFERKLTPEQIKDMKVIFDSITNTREVPNASGVWNSTLRLTAKTSRTVFSPGFALAAVAELATPMATAGFADTVRAIIPSFKGAMDIAKGQHINSKIVRDMMQLNLVGDIVSARQLQRYDADDTMHTPLTGFMGGYEKALDKVNHGIHKYGGLGYLTEVGQIMSNVSGMNWMFRMAGKQRHTSAEKKALARLGISIEDLQKLNGQKQFVSFKNKSISAINPEAWADKELLDVFTKSIQRHTDATILKPGGTNLPVWMSDPNSPLARITMQFTRYPMAAHEKLAMKGLDEASINQVIAIATSSALFAMVAQVKDLGRDKAYYDLDTEEGRKHTMMYSFSQNYMFGGASLGLEKIASAAGYSLTGDRAPGLLNVAGGASGSMLQGAQRTVKSFTDPDTEAKVARSVNPIDHFWGLNMAIGAYKKAVNNED